MKSDLAIYPPSTLRTLALYTQGLTTPNGSELPPGMERIYRQVEQLGCIQIDTLHVVQRSHYLVLWSRLGSYDAGDFNRLIYDPDHRRLFGGWRHAATIIPLADYRYQMPHQRRLRERPGKNSAQWLSEPGTIDLLQMVRQRIHTEGGLRASDFAYDGPRRGSWWDWKPAKNALEHLYAWGELAISNRINFQRVYDPVRVVRRQRGCSAEAAGAGGQYGNGRLFIGWALYCHYFWQRAGASVGRGKWAAGLTRGQSC